MKAGATVAVFLAVAAGAVLLGFWADPQRAVSDRRSVVLASVHVGLALAAVSSWIVALIVRSLDLQRLAVGGLVATAALGVSTLLSSRVRETSGRFSEAPIPVPRTVLMAHGSAAALAIALTALIAAKG